MLNKIGITLQPPSPASSGAGGKAEQNTEGNGAAWRREMEKQEMALWLKHGPLPSAQREQSLFRQASQSPVTADTPSAGLHRVDEPAKPREDTVQASKSDAPEPSSSGAAATTVDTSRATLHLADNTPAEFPPTIPVSQANTAGGSEQRPPVLVRAVSTDGLVESVMSQLKQEIGANISSPPASPYIAVAQPSQAGRLEGASAAPTVRQVSGFDPSEAEPTAGQKNAKATFLDEPEEVAAQRSTPSSLPPDGEAPPVRIHTFWSDQAVRIWVGTDGSAALDAQQLALAAHDLRRLLREQGATLESLTVNGQTVVEQEAGQAPLQNSALASERPIARTTQA